MREIKFRTFLNNKFYYWGFIDGGFLSPPSSFVESLSFSEIEKRSDQYVNKRNDNNEEIYEGDVIEGIWNLFYTQPHIKGIVQFDIDTLSYVVIGMNILYKDEIIPLCQIRDILIIGNKYKNIGDDINE